MHDTIITIKKLWPPFKAGDKRTTLEDTAGGKYRVEVVTAAGFKDGETVNIGWTPEQNTPEFGGKEYKLIKKISYPSAARRTESAPARSTTVADVGPHVGMWEKRASELLYEGMAESDIVAHGIRARQLALAIVQANLDEKQTPVQSGSGSDDPNDSLEF